MSQFFRHNLALCLSESSPAWGRLPPCNPWAICHRMANASLKASSGLFRRCQGDSIALNGACMTVTTLNVARQHHHRHPAESLDKTTGLAAEGPINSICRPFHRPASGHLVSGHVDGLGQVTHFGPVGESWELRVLAPAELGALFGLQRLGLLSMA